MTIRQFLSDNRCKQWTRLIVTFTFVGHTVHIATLQFLKSSSISLLFLLVKCPSLLNDSEVLTEVDNVC